MKYGYVRVSTRDQNVDRQILALEEQGIDRHNIFIDKQSGKDFNRTNYARLYKRIGQGDILTIKSIDRLGRNYNEMLEEWRKITKKKKCSIIVIDTPLLSTLEGKDLTGVLIADIVLQLLSYMAPYVSVLHST